MVKENWHYKVKLDLGLEQDGGEDPTFLFALEEKDKMQLFVDVCLDNGHEVSIVTWDQK